MSILAAFLIAIFVSVLFSSPYRSKGSSMAPLAIFFFVLFLSGIAGGYWIVPFGPVMWGVAWLPLLSIIFVVAILFSAPPPHQRTITTPGEKAEMGAFAAVSIFTWILFVVLLIAIFAGIFQSHPM
jgi:magnesium-transporting ATPase (P-type)